MSRRAFGKELAVYLIIFVIALLPRVLGLRVFATIDEQYWAYGSAHFLAALWDHDWTGTLWRYGHPGVTTMWAGTIGLVAKYLAGSLSVFAVPEGGATLPQFLQPALPIPYYMIDINYLAMMRIPTILLTALGVVGTYSLTRMLLGNRIALLGTLLIALDPFQLAYSRLLLPDPFLVTFMSLALYSFMVYIGLRQSPFYLVLSGLMVGLAFLSKAPALFLVPYIVLITIGVHWIRSGCVGRARTLRYMARDLVIWGIVAALTFVVLWPAMWVSPVEAVQEMIGKIKQYESISLSILQVWSPHKAPLIGLDRLPGFLSYPVLLFFRMTPVELIGVVAAASFLSASCYRNLRLALRKGDGSRSALLRRNIVRSLFSDAGDRQERVRQKTSLLWLSTYVVLFMLFMSLLGERTERYILPVFPPLALIAAVGLWQLGEKAAKIVRNLSLRATLGMVSLFVVILGVIFQAGLSLPHHPYYFTCYNPLAGGQWTAPHMIPVGNGEGLDQAAGYLNTRENAASLRASARPPASFAPFFLGTTIPFYWGKYNLMPWYATDYVVFYIAHVQPARPNPATVNYFRSLKPEYTVRLKGINYAWIYKTPEEIPDSVIPAQYIRRAQFGDCLALRGYDVDASRVPFDGKLRVNLYWQGLCTMNENYGVDLKLLNGVRHIWGQQASQLLSDGLPTSLWEEAIVVQDEREIEVLPGTLPGYYLLEVILYDFTSEKWVSPQGEEDLLLGPVELPRRGIPNIESLDIEYPLKVNLGGKIRLLGYNLESGFRPGDGIHLTLFWQCLEKMNQDYTVFTHLIDGENNIWAQKDNPPVDGFYTTTRWEQGEIVRDQYDLLIPSSVSPGEYRLEVGMYLAETGERLEIHGEEGQLLGNQVLLSPPVTIR